MHKVGIGVLLPPWENAPWIHSHNPSAGQIYFNTLANLACVEQFYASQFVTSLANCQFQVQNVFWTQANLACVGGLYASHFNFTSILASVACVFGQHSYCIWEQLTEIFFQFNERISQFSTITKSLKVIKQVIY